MTIYNWFMIDGVEFYCDNDFLKWEYPMPKFYEYNELLFRPIWGNRGGITKYTAKDDYGLLHVITPKEYKIKNSAHKAYSKVIGKSGNWSDFSFTDFIKMVNMLSNRYKLDPARIYIRKLEIGVNIELNNPSMEYISLIRAFKFSKPSVDMRTMRNKFYGRKFFTGNYQLKVYDKTRQVFEKDRINISSNMIRFEAVIKKVKLKDLGVFTLADLINYSKFSVLVDFLHEMFYGIAFDRRYDVSTLTANELELYIAGAKRFYWVNLPKCSSPSTASRRRKQYKIIITKLDKENPFANPLLLELRKKVVKKINQLSVESFN
ncbi:hypothetical protein Q4Q34_16030 [Flavivirga abyssicola]|uniref:hypothetical protein n=1 Tax=Flavivirga abyssicola TaxID=3063533 RepID=UPI0026DF8C34|nr:hypothetical protein [Flavivirga sp. MEBiC07777]WVK12726.1 hypothetical protein Q4Q34_16030 [Flavivirga sp. MEBiC07777]